VRSPRVADRAGPETVARRRRIAIFAALAVAVLIVIIVIVATSGGSGNSPNVVATTTQPTQPTTSPQTTATTPTTTTPSLHVTIPAGGNLSSGDSGTAVVALQKALKALGFYDGKADGDFGSGTEAAVIAFQEAHNLDQDGVVGTDTAQALNQALAAAGR
jgi:peptidoglycan hydrolase-like protein with peptidoglycan-binding domain